MNIAQRLDDILTALYDYEYIDLDKFYNANENKELLYVLNSVLDRHEINSDEEKMMQELYNNIDSFIKFETNDNSRIGDF